MRNQFYSGAFFTRIALPREEGDGVERRYSLAVQNAPSPQDGEVPRRLVRNVGIIKISTDCKTASWDSHCRFLLVELVRVGGEYPLSHGLRRIEATGEGREGAGGQWVGVDRGDAAVQHVLSALRSKIEAFFFTVRGFR